MTAMTGKKRGDTHPKFDVMPSSNIPFLNALKYDIIDYILKGILYMADILVVDDEKDIADLIELYLDDYKVHKFYSSVEVLNYLKTQKIDLAILDVMMPEIDGYELCKEIRKKYNFPIIFLTAKIDEKDKLRGFSIGADDYIEKPFRALEFLARVKSHLRRYQIYSNHNPNESVISVKDLIINNEKHEITVGNKKINLTPLEFSIMWYLSQRKGTVVSNEELFKAIWSNNYYNYDSNTITVHIRHIREKLHDDIDNPKYIKTVWGIGYEITE